MKRLIALLLILSLVFLCGCYDYTDVENLSYITAITIDVADNGEYEYCFQFVNPLEDGEFVTYTAQSSNLHGAIIKVTEMITRKISFTHTKLVAVSLTAAQDMDRAIEGFNESGFYRPDLTLAVVYGQKASGIFSQIDPALEGNAARYYDLSFSTENSLSKTNTTVKDYFSHNSCVLPLMNGSVINGIAVIDKGKLLAIGDSEEAVCYNLLTKGTKQGVYSQSVISSSPPEVEWYWDGENPCVEYTVTVNVAPRTESEKVEDVCYQLEKSLNAFVGKYITSHHADIINAEKIFKKAYLTEKDWKAAHWDKAAQNLNARVKVVADKGKK